ncbi:MAG TPA: stage II sporulation protein M [Pyrinomonadaceae bacterium]|nr:stage II sporulation protein M [Chloracidobacterium sp.]HQX54707.1 stage II sporulation protein M [Pyrinomonadaceae bacterium]MBK7801959.1 stage II sporulation protein M [Chloracidobacterium sp.]MBK9437898.1 stage II sporulation protein M [Chloracidobacterium sp.]MBL0242262.1 stage II sporulation protein M [Chloracidobacterium sp.]
MNRFLDDKKNNWQRLEDLLSMMSGVGLRGLSRAEVREFGELYRRAAADLAIARSETRDPKLINYLNSLVIRAHGRIYRSESDGVGTIRKFFTLEFPRAFRANWKYMALAFGVFAAFALFGFIATWVDVDFTHFVALSGVTDEIRANNQWWSSLNEANQVGASQIMSNNIIVTFRVFAFGAFFGVGAFYDLAFEGARLGSVFAACYQIDPAFGNALASFVVGHGVIELSCIFFCGGAGMMIGYAMIDPGDLTRAQALKKKGVEAAKIVIGCACLLVIAGTIEGFLSPSALPPGIKIATGVLSGIVMYSYLILVGRIPADDEIRAGQDRPIQVAIAA